MSKIYYPITACLKKSHEETVAVDETISTERQTENPRSSSASDSANTASSSSAVGAGSEGWVRRMSSGLYGIGVGSAKLVATTTYNLGSGVINIGSNVAGRVVARPKPKKE